MTTEISVINVRLEKIESSLQEIQASVKTIDDSICKLGNTMDTFMVDFNETSTKAQSMAETIFNKDNLEGQEYGDDLGGILNISSNLKDLKDRINNITKNL